MEDTLRRTSKYKEIVDKVRDIAPDRVIIAVANPDTNKLYTEHVMNNMFEGRVRWKWIEEGDIQFLIPDYILPGDIVYRDFQIAMDDYVECLANDTFEDTPIYEDDNLDIRIETCTSCVVVLGIVNENSML